MSIHAKLALGAPRHVTVEAADAALTPLVEPAQQAIARKGPVLVVGLWEPIPFLPLLPFHLHLRWPDRAQSLPLSADMSLMPVQSADQLLLQTPLYAPDNCYSNRVFARWYRNETGTAQPNDFRLCDWEEGYRRHRADVGDTPLPACAYVAVTVVQPSGTRRQMARPRLGRFAGRGAHRPLLLIPGRGADTDEALIQLAQGALLIINLQETRTIRARQAVRQALEYRGSAPTLLVAACPTEALALDLDRAYSSAHAIPLELLGTPPQLTNLTTAIVGRDRPQEDARFADAVLELRGHAASLEPLLDLAEQAWWAARQSLGASMETHNRLLGRYFLALDRLRRLDSVEAGLLTSATALLEQTSSDDVRAQERLNALVEAAERHLARPAGWRTLMVVSNGVDIGVLRVALCERLQSTWDELRRTGLDVHTVQTTLASTATASLYDSIVTAGYAGRRTLDVILQSRARHAHMVLDPVEARVASAHIDHLRAFLQGAGADHQSANGTDAISKQQAILAVLDRLQEAVSPVAAAFPRDRISLDVSTRGVLHGNSHDLEGMSPIDDVSGMLEALLDSEGQSVSHLLITFVDGTSLLCGSDRRFDVLDESAAVLRPATANELCVGDAVILLEQDSQALLSDQLMRILDEGELRADFQRRREWLLLVAGVSTIHKRSIRSISEGLRARGVTVSTPTIRTWVPHVDRIEEGMVPRSWKHFSALADELGIQLPSDVLRSYFDAIRRWRTLHRVQGRRLVRIMRYAALGMLDAWTMAQIEDIWGWRARDMVQGARVCVVEETSAWEPLEKQQSRLTATHDVQPERG